jgi:hypothetical protein
MGFTIFLYALLVLTPIWWILGLILPKIKRRTVFFAMMAVIFIYVLCFVAGLFFSIYEPQSYWHSMPLSMSFFNDHLNSDNNLLEMMDLPIIFVLQLFLTSFRILFTHFTIGFAVSYACGIFILYNWWLAAYRCWKMRNPRKGFGDNIPLDEMFKRSYRI